MKALFRCAVCVVYEDGARYEVEWAWTSDPEDMKRAFQANVLGIEGHGPAVKVDVIPYFSGSATMPDGQRIDITPILAQNLQEAERFARSLYPEASICLAPTQREGEE